jgi:tetratricopeptide (TPR) repeat protein
VARLTEEAAGGGAASGLAGALYEATAGNPFFVEETLRLLIAEGRIDKQAEDLPVPPTVRDTIRRRLGRLSPQCRDVLSTASIVGRETDATFLAALCGRSADDLPSALAEALSAGCMVEAPGAPGRYRFSHALIGQTLYEDLAASRQLHLHRRAGEVLESLHAADPDRRLAELAHHFYCAAAGEVAGKAVEYCTRAGEAAMSRLAYEEAVLLYERALHALELARLSDERGCCDLLLAKAEAQMTCGDTREARATFERAAEAAKRLRAPQSLARAALGFGTLKAYMVTNADPRLLSLLEHALVAIGEEESPLRATVLARLAYELVWAGCPDRCRRLAEQALGMARRVADPAALASALDAWHCAFLGGADPRELVAVASDLIRVAGDLGQRQLVWLGHVWRLHDFVELGDASAMLEEIETLRRMAEGSRQPFLLGFLGVARAMQALLEGRFETAERLAADYSTSSGPAFGQAALVRYFLHSWWARVEQGRLEEFEPLVRANLAQAPPEARFRLPLAFVYAELGRDAELRAEFEAIAAAGFAELPRDWSWLFSMALLSMICATLRDTPRARSLYGLLLTHESRVAVIPTAVLCLGSIAHHLGTLASTLERPDEAEAHLEHAITVHARLGARPWLARSRYELARTLLARGGPGDHERATTLLDQALEAASELGMKPLAAKAEAERGRIAVEYAESGSGPGASVAPQVARRDCLRRDGDHWTFVFEGQSILLKDSHGIRYIAALLRKPTTPLPSTELASAASDRSEEMAPPRSPERARVNVTRSIADSIRRIGETSPGLARYLRRTIRTGASCCYRPDVGISIEVAT